MEWWVTRGDRKPVGPASTELVIQGIEAGMVPEDALVCELGGTSWKPLGDVAAFSIAIERRGKGGFDPSTERTSVDPPGDDPLTKFDDVVEHTVADRTSRSLSEPPPRRRFDSFGEMDESTIVDKMPFPQSDPPSES